MKQSLLNVKKQECWKYASSNTGVLLQREGCSVGWTHSSAARTSGTASSQVYVKSKNATTLPRLAGLVQS